MRESNTSGRSFAARLLLAAALAGMVTTAPALAATPVTYQTGQSVEVREGDSWSTASVVQKEGRKYLVHYADADATTDEWVGPDRMRLPGTAGTPVAPAGAAPQPAPVTAAPPANGGAHHSKPGDMFPKPAEVIPQTEPNRSAVEVDQSAEAPAVGSVVPDPGTNPFPVESWKLRTHSVDDKMSVKQLLPCSGGGAILGFADFFDKARRVERVGTTAPSALATLPQASLPMAASPSGGLLVCRGSAFGFGNNARIDAYTLPAGAAAAVPLVSFTPYPAESGDGKGEDIQFVTALSDTRIITCDGKGRLMAWDIAANSVIGIWRVDLGSMPFAGFGVNVVLSPGGKWLAGASKDAITFVDAAKGQLLGKIALSPSQMSFELACSPTGKTLIARAGNDSLIGFDVVTGKQLRMVAQPANVLGKMCCPDDGFALIEGRTLLDVNTGAVISQFQPPEGASVVATGPGATLIASDAKLAAVHLPDAAIRAAVAASGDTALALKPGMPVKVDIQLDLGDQEKAEVDTAIRKKLTDDGFVISADADITVVCRTEPGEQHEHVYSKARFGRPFFAMPGGNGTSIILTDKVTRLTITQKGLVIWERKRNEGPANRFPLKDGESLEDGAKATIQYDPKFLINLTIPPYIAMPQKIVPAPADHRQQSPEREGKPV